MRVNIPAVVLLAALGAAPLTAQAPVPQRDGAPRTYVIGPQDQLSITVFEEAALTGKYRVENDGFITFPLLARVRAAGRSLGDLQSELTSLLANGFLKNPQVRVEIDQYKSQQVVVTGEVRTPGPITITGNTMTLLTALAMAGSPTASASNEVIVVHPAGPGETEGETVRINRKDLELGRAGMDVVLRDGDIINVPKAQTFYIGGQVRNPGSYVLDPGMTVDQAIVLAGGMTDRASDRRIKASRMVNGKLADVDLRRVDKVQPGDTINVGSRLF
jgi:polysaccharide biosynthesis/export protein